MKMVKKGIACLLSSVLITGIIPISAQAEAEETFGRTTMVLEDGTIHTRYNSPKGNHVNTYYTVDDTSMYRRYDHADTYSLNVVCTNAAEFEEAFSEQYNVYQQENGTYVISLYSDFRGYYGYTCEEAEEIASVLLESSNVESVSVMCGYSIYDRGMYSMMPTIWVCSDAELSVNDFDWAVEMGYIIKDIVPPSEGGIDDHEVNISYPDNMEEYEGIYTFMLNCISMPTVYAVEDFMYENAVIVPLQYETIATYGNAAELTKGDINADGTIDITDAMLILQHYAESAASSVAAASETNMDVNGDGTVGIDDATEVLQIYAQNAAGVNVS